MVIIVSNTGQNWFEAEDKKNKTGREFGYPRHIVVVDLALDALKSKPLKRELSGRSVHKNKRVR